MIICRYIFNQESSHNIFCCVSSFCLLHSSSLSLLCLVSDLFILFIRVYRCNFCVDRVKSSMLLKICKSTENYSFRLFYHMNYRPTKADKNSEELLAADRHVEKYKEVLDKICRKFVPNPISNNTQAINVDQDARDKRCKKVHEYKLAQSMEESIKDLPDGVLRDVLENCGKLWISLSFFTLNNCRFDLV